MLVYLAGPISTNAVGSIEENCRNATAVYLDLVAAGYIVYCPHIGHPFDDPRISEDAWLALGLEFVKRSTHVVMLPNWQHSRGSRVEKDYAEMIGKVVYEDVDKFRQECPIHRGATHIST